MRKKLIGGLAGLALVAGSVVAGVGVANAADGTIQCSTYRWPYAFSYTPTHANYPNKHIRDQVNGSGYQTHYKWEGGNLTTVAPWKYDRYPLIGSYKSAWCEN